VDQFAFSISRYHARADHRFDRMAPAHPQNEKEAIDADHCPQLSADKPAFHPLN
jgi:hypothetical protein